MSITYKDIYTSSFEFYAKLPESRYTMKSFEQMLKRWKQQSGKSIKISINKQAKYYTCVVRVKHVDIRSSTIKNINGVDLWLKEEPASRVRTSLHDRFYREFCLWYNTISNKQICSWGIGS